MNQAIMCWAQAEHKKHWNSIEGCRYSRIFFTDLDNSRAKYLRGLNRNKLAWATGFITGHCALKRLENCQPTVKFLLLIPMH
ncbi:hypothetical protein C0J52_02477 [Blattella germanica]|nr:hypothetical protein C0J52_02477 [Blattella germanica]